MPTLLAFDTSTETMHVALGVAEHVYLHESPGGALASSGLIPVVMTLLNEANIGLRDLDAIAFGHGPGAFTGLRTACSVAQGLAYGASKPVLPISSLLAVAHDASPEHVKRPFWVTIDARMNEIYAAQYERCERQWHTVCEPRLYSLDALHQKWAATPPQHVAGNAITVFDGRLHVGHAQIFPHAAPRGHSLLHLAKELWQQGGFVAAEQALPLYLRDHVADTVAQRQAAGAAKAAQVLATP